MTLLLLSGLSVSMPASAKTSPLAELQQTGFYGRVHAWKNITRKAHDVLVKVPKQAPVIVSDYHSSVGANGLRRGGTHNGVDIFAAIGSPIIAAADGVVIKAKVDKCWGPSMLVSHGLDKTGRRIYALYGHVKNFKVRVGQKVKRGQQIAEMGNDIFTSCGAGFHHLHFQISYSPKSIPLFGWGWASFVSDGAIAPNPHMYWADGAGKITCFEKGKMYKPSGLTYPVPCKIQPKKAKPRITIVAKKVHESESEADLTELAQQYSNLAAKLIVLPKTRTKPQSINRIVRKLPVYQDMLEQEFLMVEANLLVSEGK
ncbi:M23 family metallopeptidase [Leucothrix arctica]|uniref:M23 family metallopeptidase n=1 Tax=Leucothrix arctica TaxID=1481894 RepID=UPI001BA950E7|nr:M23 family metallopeptidase [Leucothrix arctica]